MAFRVGMLVLATTLATSAAMSWVSVGSLEGFLRSRIDQNFPELLESSRGRLDLWYRQRVLDFEVFSRSEILRRIADPRQRSRQEVDRYLGYLLGSFPQYEGLLIVGSEEGVWTSVGAHPSLPDDVSAELARIDGPTITGLHRFGDAWKQVVAVPIEKEDHAHLLVGVMPLEALEEPIVAPDLFDSLVGLVDESGHLVAGKLPVDRLPETVPDEDVRVVEDGRGGRFVVARRPLGRFGWDLVVSQDYGVAFAPVQETVQQTLLTNLFLGFVSSMLVLGLVAWRMQPIIRLAEGARRIADGDADVRVSEAGSLDEVGQLARAFNEMSERLAENRLELETRNQELISANEVLEQLSITDGLTKLHNHRHFQDQFTKEAKRAERSGDPMCLILIDIDDFKKLNDRLGHSAGDRVLENVAQLMNSLTRETDYLARYGGEEFAMILPKTDLEGAVALGEKMRLGISRLEVPVSGVDGWVQVTASFGVATFRTSTSATFEAADKALYEAKASGKDCVIPAADD